MFERSKICLNGYWDFHPGDGTLGQIPKSWEETKILVPSPWNINAFSAPYSRHTDKEEVFVRGGDFELFPGYPAEWETAESGWYQTEFFVPEDWKGKSVNLLFEAVHYYSEFYINGVLAHTDRDGFLPVEFPVGPYVSFGEKNSLAVGVRKMSQFKLRLPEGGYQYEIPTGSFWGDTIAGIWQDVYLLAYPESYISDAFVTTDINSSELTVQTEISGAYQETSLEFYLRPLRGTKVYSIGSSAVAGGITEYRYDYGPIREEIKLWWPDSPELYYLDICLKDREAAIDVKTLRFGFRSFEAKGNKFYLNGIPYNLRNDSWHYMGFPYQTPKYARLWYKMAKEANANHVRLHAQVYPEFFLDIADEMGMLITAESSIWGSHCRYHYSAEFIENCKKHVERMIKRDRNHPSIVLWNVENECTMAYMVSADNGVKDEEELNERLYGLAEHGRKFDTTRPVCADGGKDYGGRLPVVNLHYPGRRPGIKTGKPIAIGEMGSMYYSTPDMAADLQGEAVFLSFQERLEAVGKEVFDALLQQRKWAAQTCVFNLVWYGLEPLPFKEKLWSYEDVTAPGVKPHKTGPYISTLNAGYDEDLPEYIPNPVFYRTKAAYMPERFFFEGNRIRFYNGETGFNKISVFNDSLEIQNYRLVWSVSEEDKENAFFAVYEKDMTLNPSCYEELELTFALPEAEKISNCKLNVAMKLGNKLIYEESLVIRVYNRDYLFRRIKGKKRLAAAGTFSDTLAGLLKEVGIPLFKAGITEEPDLLLVTGETKEMDFTGKRVLILDPDKAGFNDWVIHQEVKKAFLSEGYPVLSCDLKEDDIGEWDNGSIAHQVFSGELNLNARALLTTGKGIPLVLETLGTPDRNIVSCLSLLEAALTEPAAAVLLGNLTEYLAEETAVECRECVVISRKNSSLVKFLKDIKAAVRLTDWEDRKAIRAIRGENTVIADGSYPVGYLDEFTPANTKQVLVMNLISENIPVSLKGYMEITPWPLYQLVKEDNTHPLIKGIHTADLYGLEKGKEAIITGLPIFIKDKDKVRGILKNAGLDWRVWNHQGEQVKTAAIKRSGREAKTDRYGLAAVKHNGMDIYISQLNFTAQNRKLKKAGVTLFSNLEVKLEPKLEDDFERMLYEGICEDKVKKALMLYQEKEADSKTLSPGINKTEGSDRFWKVTAMDKRLSVKPGIYYYGLYIYSPSDRRDLLLNPDLIGLQAISSYDKQVYLNRELIGEGKDIQLNALCLNSGWNLFLVKETVDGAGKEMPENGFKGKHGANSSGIPGTDNVPVLIRFFRKDHDDIDLQFSLEPGGQTEVPRDFWELRTNFNETEKENVLKGKGYYWVSGKDQHPGMYFQIDLKEVHRISGIRFSGKSLSDNNICLPRSFSIQICGDEGEWKDIYAVSNEEELYPEDGKMLVHLGNIKAKQIRLMLTSVALKPWILSELKIYEQTGF